ncbi:MAG: hypothetical protein ABJO09_00460 [Hyphomicrobiales bacterium]
MRWILVSIAALAAVPVGYLLYAYFLSPAGIDISASQICIKNDSERTLIVSAKADSGAEILGLLGAGEELCAPSPVAGDTGTVWASESEDADEGCTLPAKAGQLETLLSFSPSNNCKWAQY